LPAKLQSLSLIALLDTGATTTVVSPRAAIAAGADRAALSAGRTVRILGASTFDVTMRTYTFDSLTIGTERIARPTLLVGAAGKDIVLGLDFLRRHRVWIAYHARRVFISTSEPSDRNRIGIPCRYRK
jgi:predicted aspartyl protease